MAKTRQSHVTAKALVSPMFSWTNAVLRGGQMVLDSMGAAVRNARTVRVAVLPDVAAARKHSKPRKAKAKAKARSKAPARRAKSKRRR